MKSAILSFLALAALTFPAQAISIAAAGSAYEQDFNSLAKTGSGISWTNNSTLTGWSLFQSTGTAVATYNTGAGGSNAGSFYSFGTNDSTERALGGAGAGGTGAGGDYFGNPASGAIAGWMAVSFSNGSGGIFNGFEVSWDGEQWRNGGNTSPQTMVFEYGFGVNFTDVSIWETPGGLFDFTSVVNSVPAGAVVGNSEGFVDGRGGSVSNLSWAVNDTLWLRWVERNDTGNDHGLAIDNFSFTANRASASVPEGGPTLAMLGLSFAGLVVLRRKSAGK